jgi:diguanylate cyclase (GGDEF)-like protein
VWREVGVVDGIGSSWISERGALPGARVLSVAARYGVGRWDRSSSLTSSPIEHAVTRPDLRVGALIAAMWCLSGMLFLLVPERSVPTANAPWWFVVTVAVVFGIFEKAVFNVAFRRHAISFSLSEIPLVLCLVFVAPSSAIFVRWSVSIPVLFFLRRSRGLKLVFNTSLFAFEMMLGFAAFRGLIGWWGDSTSAITISVILVPLLTALSTSVLISTAISMYEGGLRHRVVTELRGTWWLFPVASVLGAMTMVMALIEPALALFAAFPAAGIWFVLYRFGVVNQTLRDLDTLHGFAGRIGTSLDPVEIGESSVDELFEVLRVGGVVVLRFTDHGVSEHRRGEIDVRLPSSADDLIWRGLLARRGARSLPADDLRRIDVAGTVSTPVLVAPLWDAGDVYGAVVAVAEYSAVGEFIEAERRRLDSMSAQLAVSLRRGMLHERLEHEARHDALTGLPGRTVFERAVSDAVERSRDGVSAVLMLDLDRFKEVNDTLGHSAGDELLIEFSHRMSGVLADSDVLARLSGDEFAILCHRSTSEEVLAMAEDVVRVGGLPVTLDGLEIVVTVSVGVAEITAADGDPQRPMRRADIAMYNAKWQRSGAEVYRDEIDRRTPARLSMLGDLRTAIERDELDVVYQPKLDLRTGAVVGAEALVRWEHATRGVVAPTEFVRVAEDTGLIKSLTDLVLSRGIAALRRFGEAGLGIGLAVNLSTHDLFDSRLPDRVRGYLADNGVAPGVLTLEITESSLLVDAPRTRATINDLHEVGLALAVDDFGTGYSSLSYLRRLPVQELKIDQSFVSRMLTDQQDEVIVRSTIDLGHNLGLSVIAEGVESDEAMAMLKSFGCDAAQGYGIAPPMSADDLIAWIAQASSVVTPTSGFPAV